MQTDANTTPTNQSHAAARAGQEDSRHVVLTEMRSADELASLSGRSASDMRRDLDRWKADGRIFSIRDEGVEYFALFALDPAEEYRPYPAVARVIEILSEVFSREESYGLASWFLGLNSYLDDQRPADLLASDPEWVIEAAQDEANESTSPRSRT
jgi:hypothetical protein